MFDRKSDKNMFLLSTTFCRYICLTWPKKALMINTYLTMIRIRLKREFKQTMIYMASKFKLCFVIGVVTI